MEYEEGFLSESKILTRFHERLEKHSTALDVMGSDRKLFRLQELFFSTISNLDFELFKQKNKYEKKIEKLEKRIKDLENRFLKDSRNSHKPPSSDGLKKPPKTQSLREKSKRKPGGQKGHKGYTLEWCGKPEKTVIHERRICSNCGRPLRLGKTLRSESRQVVDIEDGKRKVTEHKVLVKRCGHCESEMSGEFPEWLKAKVQYGKEVKSLALYFVLYQLVPYKRTSEIFLDVWGVRISTGTLVNMVARADENLKSWENAIIKNLVNEKVVGFDETGIRSEGKLHWLHVIRSSTATLYRVHTNRGTPAFESIGILPEFRGTAIHDGLRSYFEYTKCKHGLCNAHHLRELKYVDQTSSYKWPKEFFDFLLKTKNSLERSKRRRSRKLVQKIDRQYDRLLKRAYAEMGAPDEWKEEKWIRGKRKKHRKQQKRDPERLLLNRLRDHRTAVLAFVSNKDIPFTNNDSERDLRMAKTKQKVSGCFRSGTGADSFCRGRSYVSTNQKNNIQPLQALRKIS